MSPQAEPRILLLDTDVASGLQRGNLRPDYVKLAETYDIYAITWVTEAEWRVGLRLNDNPKLQERFEKWMNLVLKLSQDDEITERYADLAAIAKQKNQSVKSRQNDTWIAAAAVRHDVPLMTLNRGDYMVFAKHGGLQLEPPP